MNSPRLSSALCVVFLSLAATACHHHKDEPLSTVHLEWRGPDERVEYKDSVVKALVSKHLHLAFTDARTATSIGKYEDDNKKFVVTTTDDVVRFCTVSFADRVKPLGVKFVESGEDFTLRGDVQNFFVNEENTYLSAVDVRFSLVTPDGKEAWSSVVNGKESRWGSSHNADNYNEGLSTAFNDAIKQLLSDPAFEAGLLGKAPPAPEAVVLPAQLPKGAPTLHLEWRSIDATKAAGSEATLAALRAMTLQLKPLTDGRTEPLAIGKYDNDKGAILYTPDNVAGFYSKVLTERLKTQGALSTSSNFTLAGEILELTVVEGSEFNATARVRFTLTKGNTTVWNGLAEGKSKNWGRTHKAENLNDALSNAFDELMRNLMSNAELAAALK